MKSKLDLQWLTVLGPRWSPPLASPAALARRTLLRGAGSGLIAAPLWPLLACDDAANDNAVNDDVLTTQALYNGRGTRTTDQTDTVIAIPDHAFQTQRSGSPPS